MATHDTIGTASLNGFGMNIRPLFVCGALLLFASVVYGAGSYQRTKDGQTLVWRDYRNLAMRQRGPASVTRMGSPPALVY